MNLKIGIVGLPNVGKSTLFNALTKNYGAEVANYPFCTIDPNVGIVEIKDDRLNKLAEISKSQKIIPATVEFVDIAGLVKGASEGEGLGNKFLSHIRECDAVLQVLRNFENDDIIHVHGGINPKSDMEVINSELIISDLETIEKRINSVEKKGKTGDKQALAEFNVFKKIKDVLLQGDLANTVELNDSEKDIVRDLHLLTMKPFLYVLNVTEEELLDFDESSYKQKLQISENIHLIPISAKLEQELIELSEEDGKEFLENMNMKDTGINRLIKTAYNTLGLQYFFTSGEKESRAWTIKKEGTAPQAAGVIHTDFEKGFIKADVVDWKDFVEYKGWSGARDVGKVRMEGKEYIMKDGDVVLFKFNV